MDRLIAEVLKKIADRQTKMRTVSYSTQAGPPGEQLFTDFGQVQLQGMSIALLVALYRADQRNSWVAWILQGISYNVQFTFTVNSKMVNFIPLRMLRDWPVTFTLGNGTGIRAFYQQSVGRSEIAALPDRTMLIVPVGQRLTTEAQTVMQEKHIIKQVRTDEDCIWQK